MFEVNGLTGLQAHSLTVLQSNSLTVQRSDRLAVLLGFMPFSLLALLIVCKFLYHLPVVREDGCSRDESDVFTLVDYDYIVVVGVLEKFGGFLYTHAVFDGGSGVEHQVFNLGGFV